MLSDKMGGWPVLNQRWNPQSFVLFDVLRDLRFYKIEPLILVTVAESVEMPTENIITIDEPDFVTRRDVLQSDAEPLFTDSYKGYMRNITSLLLRDINDRRNTSDSNIAADLADIFDLERYFIIVGQF